MDKREREIKALVLSLGFTITKWTSNGHHQIKVITPLGHERKLTFAGSPRNHTNAMRSARRQLQKVLDAEAKPQTHEASSRQPEARRLDEHRL